VWWIGAVVCVVAAALRFRTIGYCQSTATSLQRGWRRHRRVSSTIEESDLYLLPLHFNLKRSTGCAIPSVADSGVFTKCRTQRGNLLGATFQVGDTSTVLARVVVELECVRRV